MPAPVLSRGTTGRAYVWPPHQEKPDYSVPSVTTILNEYAKPWLGPWMSKEAAKFTSENLDSLVEMPRDAVYDVVNRASRRVSEGSMGKGTKVHEAIDAFVNNEAMVNDANDLPAIGAGLAFLQDHVAEVMFNEVTIFNLTYAYAGTCDLIVRLKKAAPVPKPYWGKIAIVDIKTGKRIYLEVALQLSAYANGEFIGHGDGTSEDLPPLDLALVVHLNDKGGYTAKPMELKPEIFKAFVALRTLTKYRAFIEPDVLGKAFKGSSAEVVEDADKGKE